MREQLGKGRDSKNNLRRENPKGQLRVKASLIFRNEISHYKGYLYATMCQTLLNDMQPGIESNVHRT